MPDRDSSTVAPLACRSFRQVPYVGPLTMIVSLFLPCIVLCPLDSMQVDNNVVVTKTFGGKSFLCCFVCGLWCLCCCPIDVQQHVAGAPDDGEEIEK